MKRLVRHPAVQRMLSATFSGYLKILYRSQRWIRADQDKADAVWKAGGGAILCLWHQGIPLSAPTWVKSKGAQDMRVLISRSADGEFITQVMDHLGFPAIRGSRQRVNSVGDKRGAPALRDMIKWVKDGGAVALTPDGPKGPARVMGEGPAVIAAMTGAPVLLVGLACKPCLYAERAWDRTIFPLPFGKAAMVWGGPFHAGRNDDLDALAKVWTQELNALTERAEALVQ